MKKNIILILFVATQLTMHAQDSIYPYLDTEHSVYQFKIKDIDGNDFDFACLEGKKILIVNTGSKCMYRNQLSSLQELYEKYVNTDLVVIAFPSNDFFNREPKDNAWIKNHYRKKYGIRFPVMSKSSVKGENINPVFDFLSNKLKNGKMDAQPKWNFQKYLIDNQGYLFKTVNPGTNPLDIEIIEWIEGKK